MLSLLELWNRQVNIILLLLQSLGNARPFDFPKRILELNYQILILKVTGIFRWIVLSLYISLNNICFCNVRTWYFCSFAYIFAFFQTLLEYLRVQVLSIFLFLFFLIHIFKRLYFRTFFTFTVKERCKK